jgi:hypothetical protein
MYCDICASHDHVRPRCPKFRATKLAAAPCGFAVEGLGFFHVPFKSSLRQQRDAQTVVISVFDGSLSVPNITSELEKSNPRVLEVECGRNRYQFF